VRLLLLLLLLLLLVGMLCTFLSIYPSHEF